MDQQRLRASVSAAVTTEDPEKLLATGAPSDEYAPEIDDLVNLVRSGEVTENAVSALWESWFGVRCGLSRDPATLTRLTTALRAWGS